MTTKHFSLDTKRGPVSFSTDLEWDEAIAILTDLKSEFAQSLVKQWHHARIPLSPVQIGWVYKLAEDQRVRQAAPAPAPAPETPKPSVTKILESLRGAYEMGIKKPQLRLSGPDGEKLKIAFMGAGKNTGGCWVTLNGDLVGKIFPNGTLDVYDNRQALQDHLLYINDNYETALKEYGQLTTVCSCCGIKLTNPESILRGIGPICAQKYGVAY